MAPQHIEGREESEFAKYARSSTPLNCQPLHILKTAGHGGNPLDIVDKYTVDGAVNFLKLRYMDTGIWEPSQQPLFLKVSLIQPHDPFRTPDADKFSYYLNRVKPFPPDMPVEGMFLPDEWPGCLTIGKEIAWEDAARAQAAYCSTVETLDGQFARVLQTLRHAGHDLDDWIIIYTSDHGELLGQHNSWFKFNFYEASARVPLIIRAPRFFKGGSRINENVNLCDLFATLCDLAGIPVPEGLDSRSLRPLLEGRTSDWDDESISQVRPDRLMIKRGHLKYIYYGDRDAEFLFDLKNDLGETSNAIHDCSHRSAVEAFRLRRASLGYGLDATSSYRNAGYACGTQTVSASQCC